MKNFDDFIDTLTQDEITSICDSCNESAASTKGFGNKIGIQTFLINLALLRRYHVWLQSSEDSDE